MKMKITIKNSTAWPSAQLMPFIRRIAREEFPGTKPSNTRSALTVRIVYTRAGKQRRGDSCSGYAYFNSSWCKVRVPYPHPGRVFPVIDFCHVVGHEFAHCRGIKHAEMGWQHGDSCNRGSYSAEHYAWARELRVPTIPAKKPKPSTDDKRALRLKRAEAAVVTWTRKQKLAATKLKLWQRKVRALRKLTGVVADEQQQLAAAACEGGAR